MDLQDKPNMIERNRRSSQDLRQEGPYIETTLHTTVHTWLYFIYKITSHLSDRNTRNIN